MTAPKVIFLMSDYGHDPTETAIPYAAFQKAGFTIHFATETGAVPACDDKMLRGLTQKLLGATRSTIKTYENMLTSPSLLSPHSWTDPTFTLTPYNLLFFPGGHEKGVRQVIESTALRSHIASYFPQTRKPSTKAVAAICHGVLPLAEAKLPPDEEGKEEGKGKSVLHDVTTTTLPGIFEGTAYWGTRALLGDYYKTYGAGSESVEAVVKSHLDNPDAQFRSSLSPSPFIVHDEKYNYISGRFPADAELLAQAAVEMVRRNVGGDV
ncbi:hypothetical protein MMC20_004065 [Loxospora ochrophaea]|nr:hypothetical protein [Loxospora ochrophaea]